MLARTFVEKVKCPECRKMIDTYREKDGLGRERPLASLRFHWHAGRRFGRPCGMGDEAVPIPQHELDEDACCTKCSFDAAEWWHLEKQKPRESRDPQPPCSAQQRGAVKSE